MKRDETGLIKNGMRKSNSIDSKVNEMSNKVRSKIFADKKCKNNPGLKKRVITKRDGRYLIYYDFKKSIVSEGTKCLS